MERRLAKLIFDTSAINALSEDPDRKAIIEGLCLAYFVGITVTALSEIVATPDEEHRRELLDLLKRLLACGHSTCCHTFRATGITAYLEAGGTIENAQAIAAHESPRTRRREK